MSEDCVNHAATLARLPDKPCATYNLNIHGFHPNAAKFGHLRVYGSDAPAIRDLMQEENLADPLHPALPYCGAEIIWAAREELACTLEDVLARRTRALFLNAKAAMEMAPNAAALMARELHCDDAWIAGQVQAFNEVAANYLLH
jgi:glycerol-3-phosphate dehydrogenase